MTAYMTATDLSKKYEDYYALSPVSFTLNKGFITTLSGPNGSGKTTLLSCLSGLITPSSGTITVDGFDLYKNETEVRKRMVYIPDVPQFYMELTAWEHLHFIAMSNHALDQFESRAENILKKLDLWEERDHFPHNFSRGMRLKLGLAMAFIRPFELLLLDEPTSALDTQSVQTLIDELEQIRNEGKAVLLSTHEPSLIQKLADQQLILSRGKLEVN